MTLAVSSGASKLAGRGLRPVSELGARRPHGVRLRYMAGCRCLKCRCANSNYETMRARARRTGDWNGIIDAAPARAHIFKLSRAGVGRNQVVAASGVARSIVCEIRAGSRTRIRARTARRILAVTTACRADKSFVSAKSLWRRIGLLLEEGFSKAELARRLGYKSRALQFNKTHVTARNDRDVAVLYRRLTT